MVFVSDMAEWSTNISEEDQFLLRSQDSWGKCAGLRVVMPTLLPKTEWAKFAFGTLFQIFSQNREGCVKIKENFGKTLS